MGSPFFGRFFLQLFFKLVVMKAGAVFLGSFLAETSRSELIVKRRFLDQFLDSFGFLDFWDFIAIGKFVAFDHLKVSRKC